MVFVTGSTGMVGARLIYDLDLKGEQIIALKRPGTSVNKFIKLVRFYTADPEALANRITWVEGDVLDYESLLLAIPNGAEVYHCAAYVSFSERKKSKIWETNVEGTANLVNACLINEASKLCHVSSIAAIGGKINDQVIDEYNPWSASGKSAYSLSKYYSELEIWRGVAEGLQVVIVNPAVILGPGIWNEGSAAFLPLVDKGLKFYTKGTTSYVDVRDVTRAMIYLMHSEQKAERFILASETFSYQEFFTSLAKSLGIKPPTIYANRILTGFAWLLMALVSFITRKPAKITRQTHRVSHITDAYNGNKYKQISGLDYIPIQKTIEDVTNHYKTFPS